MHTAWVCAGLCPSPGHQQERPLDMLGPGLGGSLGIVCSCTRQGWALFSSLPCRECVAQGPRQAGARAQSLSRYSWSAQDVLLPDMLDTHGVTWSARSSWCQLWVLGQRAMAKVALVEIKFLQFGRLQSLGQWC